MKNMAWEMVESLQSIRLAADSGLVVLIWLVQLIIYPAFHFVEKNRFIAWHDTYVRSISLIVIPLMFAQAIVTGFQCVKVPSIGNILSIVGICVAWTVTFTLSVPCHRQLQAQGNRPKLVSRLVATNWLRTAAWTGVLIAGLIQSA
jgi:uncharacterized membrane protein (DUF441 family)